MQAAATYSRDTPTSELDNQLPHVKHCICKLSSIFSPCACDLSHLSSGLESVTTLYVTCCIDVRACICECIQSSGEHIHSAYILYTYIHTYAWYIRAHDMRINSNVGAIILYLRSCDGTVGARNVELLALPAGLCTLCNISMRVLW